MFGRLKYILFVAILCCALVQGKSYTVAPPSHNYSFQSIGSNNGLSSGYVKAIVQDGNGFMWFGTKNGLNFYDGKQITRYNCYDTNLKRGNNNISALYVNPATNELWVGTDRGVYVYGKDNAFAFFAARTSDGVSVDDWVQTISCDRKGNVWILVPNQGVFRYADGQLRFYQVVDSNKDKDHLCSDFSISADDDVYVGSNHSGLFKYDRQHDRFREVGMNNNDTFRNYVITNISKYNDRKMLIACSDGNIFFVNVDGDKVEHLTVNYGRSVFLRSSCGVDDEIWIGTQSGVYVYNLLDKSVKYLHNQLPGCDGLVDNVISCMYTDRDRNLWIGTLFGGVSFLQRNGFRFDRFAASSKNGFLSSNRIRGIAQAADGRIWVGTEDNGLNVLDPSKGVISHADNFPYDKQIVLVARTYGDSVYVGYSLGGLDVYVGDNLIRHEGELFPTNHSAYSYFKDSRGNEWVGSDWGVFKRSAGTNAFNYISEIGDDWVFDIYQDSKDRIWFATMGNGVWKWSPANGSYIHYAYDENYSNGLRTNTISSVMEDHNGTIWFSTDRGGLSKYNESTDDFTTYSIEEGLPDNVTYTILEDKHGNLWFGTNNGLVRFDPRTCQSKTYYERDGLPSNQFNYHGAIKADNGYFYFGTLGGLIAFNPDKYLDKVALPKIFFTKFEINNREVTPEDGDLYGINIIEANEITLPSDISVFSLYAGVPMFTTAADLSYSYRLTPGSSGWTALNDRGEITFTNLPAGKYNLQIKVANDTDEYVRTINIIKMSPWYSTTLAYIIYALLVIALCSYLWIRLSRHKTKKLKEQERLFKVSKEKELFENKVQFFVEIAHEIRTPLTLIETPLEAIDEIGVADTRVQRYLNVIRLNAKRLLDLTQQLLDFNKIDAQRYELKFENVDIAALINSIINRFEDTMVLKDKQLQKDIPSKQIMAVVDKEAITKIISNLLNNALKYSHSKIAVILTTDDESFSLSVTSDGDKISKEDSLKIFHPFYQINKNADNGGVGIGLPLSATLASLHNGSVYVEEDDSLDNTFVLKVPLKQDGVVVSPVETNPTMAEYVMEEDTSVKFAPLSYTMLLVEDNDEMREFLRDQLNTEFAVEVAKNGVEALDMIKQHNFDIVVTDIMMPEMDGYELCRAIKDDAELSHIPVVFLTAKNDLDSKVKALQCGGESYIEKPFSLKYFKQQVMSLLNNRLYERKAFLKKPFFNVNNMKLTPVDEEFMNKVIKHINDNLSNENFNVEMMADEFCMSRSSLLRKIKTIFNLSPVELIRIVKLKKAAELIQEGKYRIGDICFMVGFSSSSYFSKLFYKQFGIYPKDFERECLSGKSINITLSANPVVKSIKGDSQE